MKELDEFPRDSLLSQIADGEQLLRTADNPNTSAESPQTATVSPGRVGAFAVVGGLTVVSLIGVTVLWIFSQNQPAPTSVEETNVPEAVVVDHIDGVEVYESNAVVELQVDAK